MHVILSYNNCQWVTIATRPDLTGPGISKISGPTIKIFRATPLVSQFRLFVFMFMYGFFQSQRKINKTLQNVGSCFASVYNLVKFLIQHVAIISDNAKL